LQAQPDLLPAGSRILVAFSGGPDSTALVHLLARLSPSHNWDVQAAHFDHGIRPDSAREAEALDARMRELDVRLHIGQPEGQLRAAHEPMRRARYSWLEGVATEIGADRIVTGHNLDDQAETVLFRLLRGTGNRGLAGIPERRGRIVRPLLSFRADEIREWLKLAGHEAVRDPSNMDIRWARNRIRHQLLPALETQGGFNVRERLLAIRSAAESVEWSSRRVAEMALAAASRGEPNKFDRKAVLSWPVPLRAEMLRLAARQRDVRLTRGAVTCAARDIDSLRSGQGFDLGGGLRIEREFDNLVFQSAGASLQGSNRLSISGIRSGNGTLQLCSRTYRIRWGGEVIPHRGAERVALFVPRDHYPLTIRGWEPGDRIRLPAGSRKLKRVFGEARVPVSARHSIPIVTDSHGNVLWVSGLTLCAFEAAAQNTELVIEIEDA
jgi:tRNA(Ile)-lysidine synthase